MYCWLYTVNVRAKFDIDLTLDFIVMITECKGRYVAMSLCACVHLLE